MNSAACPSPDELLDFLLGRTGDARADQIAAHALACAPCRLTLDQLDDSTDDLLSALRQPLEDPSQHAACRRMMEQSASSMESQASLAVTGSFPQTLRDYELLEPIGHGGMGHVYRAIHKRLKRIVAIKLIASHRLHQTSILDRFSREMETVGQLDHPHIVRAMDAGEADGVHYLVMELLEGLDSSELVHRLGPLPVADACVLLNEAIDGLHYAHERGLIHRDIKPSNLFVTTAGHLRILDFGLAQLTDGTHGDEKSEIAGSLDYMPPEQLQGRAVDHRADVYALGVTLYYWLTQTWPGEERVGRALLDVSKRRWSEPAIPVRKRRADVPVELEQLLQKMLASDVSQRLDDLPAARRIASQFTGGADIQQLLARTGLSVASPSRSKRQLGREPKLSSAAGPRLSHFPKLPLLWIERLFIVSVLAVVLKLMRTNPTTEMKTAKPKFPAVRQTNDRAEASLNDRPMATTLSERECFQVRISSDTEVITLTSSPGEGIWVRKQMANDTQPTLIAHAWDLLELKMQEPQAFALYQRHWPAEFGQAPLPPRIPPDSLTRLASTSIQWRYVSWPQGQRHVVTLTPHERVAAHELPAEQAVALELTTEQPATDKQSMILKHRRPLDEASQQRLHHFWEPWPDEQSN